jgi:hypothetical protein
VHSRVVCLLAPSMWEGGTSACPPCLCLSFFILLVTVTRLAAEKEDKIIENKKKVICAGLAAEGAR